ncbi:MAG: RNA-directed DNA polymerase [Phycisphaerae bacterium]|nr:RNA-directed DNA polymerase [Phycisphaerae bacterium]
MGLFDKIKGLFGSGSSGGVSGLTIDDLAQRLDMPVERLEGVEISYHSFTVPKSNGHQRRITAPDDKLKQVQRAILKRLLNKLAVHPNATGFRKGYSVVSNARLHVGSEVIVKLDIRNFFESTKINRVNKYFKFIGWDRKTANLLTELTTYKGGLPQGAPTSSALSNLLNYKLDSSLTTLAKKKGARYSRYADDMTFSLDGSDSKVINSIIWGAESALHDLGYRLNNRKTKVIRKHRQQRVTGLVVNEKVALPRKTRKLIRAIEHSQQNGRPSTHSADQLRSLKAYQAMVEKQGEDGELDEG